jgi:hypothetical protein
MLRLANTSLEEVDFEASVGDWVMKLSRHESSMGKTAFESIAENWAIEEDCC